MRGVKSNIYSYYWIYPEIGFDVSYLFNSERIKDGTKADIPTKYISSSDTDREFHTYL
jgi:hypothetical protein